MTENKKREPAILDIFDELRAVDNRNKKFYDNLSDEQKKVFSPLVLMRWTSGVEDSTGLGEYYITLVNELVNLNFWELSKYPDLQWLLLSLVGPGQTIRHTWIPNSKREGNSSKVDKILLTVYAGVNDQELNIIKSRMTEKDFKNLLEDLGCTDNEIKDGIKEFKKLKPTK